MHTSSRLLALSLLLLLLSGCAPDVPPIPQLPPDARVLAFGDSLTYGTGAARHESYPAVLAELTGWKVINAGVPGEVTSNGLDRLDDLLDEHEPDLLLLCHGGNDLLRKLDRGKTIANLRAMVTLSRERDIPVVLMGVPEPALFISAGADFYGKLAKELGVPLEEKIIAEVESERSLKSDQIHPNAKGYRLIAESVHRLLQQAGAL